LASFLTTLNFGPLAFENAARLRYLISERNWISSDDRPMSTSLVKLSR